jgi:hypothetical protein
MINEVWTAAERQ